MSELISVIVPCYNESRMIEIFYQEITKISSVMDKYDELVNDGRIAFTTFHQSMDLLVLYVKYHINQFPSRWHRQ